jgi:hypothetical protein
MFALFAILAWVLVMLGALLVTGFSAFGLFLKASISGAIKGGKAPSETLVNMAHNPIVKFFDTNLYGDNKITDFFFGNAAAAGNPAELNVFQLWVVPILTMVAGLFLITMGIIELHRLKKSQKVSKPFVKILLIISMTLYFILGKTLTVIAGGTFFVALVFLEIVLFDTDALNNYAEERNLVSIYREERKFEKEVNKEGKSTDNTDSEISVVQKTENSSTLDQDEKAKTSDNSVLSNEEIKYSEIPNVVEDPSSINNKKYQKYYSQWKLLKAQLDKFRAECYEKVSFGLDEKSRTKLQNKFNERAEKINIIANELKLADSFKESFIDLQNIDSETIAKSIGAPSSENMMKSNGALEQATTTFNGGEASTDYDPNIESIYADNSNRDSEMRAPSFAPPSSAPTPGEPINTFVAPQTVGTVEFQKRAAEEKAFMQQALAHAVRMDFDMLPATNEDANYSYERLTQDLNLFVETMDLSFRGGHTKISSTPTPAPELSTEAPRFDTQVTAPPTFDYIESEVTDEVATTEAPGMPAEMIRPETFVVPTTGTVDYNKRAEEEKAFMQQALARAVRMDFNMIPVSDTQSNTTIQQVETELGLFVETKDLSYNTEQINHFATKTVDNPAEIDAPEVFNTSAPAEPAFENPLLNKFSNFETPAAPSEPVVANIPTPPSAPVFEAAPVEPVAAPMPAPAVEQVANHVVEEIKVAAPMVESEQDNGKIDQIEKRMENIEKMIQSLSLAQNYPKANATMDSSQVNKLQDEFSKIEEQLARISQTFDISSNEPKNLFGALIRGYKYNNKK